MCGPGNPKNKSRRQNVEVLAEILLRGEIANPYLTLDYLYLQIEQMIDEKWNILTPLLHRIHEAPKEKDFWVYSVDKVQAADHEEALAKVKATGRYVTSARDTKPSTYGG